MSQTADKIKTRLDSWFHLKENGTTPWTELRAGLTTFITASYIIFVQPAVLAQAGMDFGAVMTATCLASAFACILMGTFANYPIALAPGMGINFYFTYTVVIGYGIPWQTALGAVFIAGLIMIVLTLCKARKFIINIIPPSMKNGIAGGIGLFITFIGLTQGGLVTSHPGTLLQMGNPHSLAPAFTLFGIILIGGLLYRKVPGALLIGLLVLSALGIPLGLISYKGLISTPPSLAPTFLQMDISGALTMEVLTIAGIFVFVNIFDTAGTLVAIGRQAGFLEKGKLPRLNRALLPDGLATTFGATVGVSTLTCYIESSAGVAEGGRTGLTSITVGVLFLLSLFFFPLAEMIGGGYQQGEITLYPITAPILVIVGCLMASQTIHIDWSNWDTSLPSFLILCGIPFTHNIADGMALGFIAYPLIKLAGKQGGQVHWGLYLIAILFILRYGFM